MTENKKSSIADILEEHAKFHIDTSKRINEIFEVLDLYNKTNDGLLTQIRKLEQAKEKPKDLTKKVLVVTATFTILVPVGVHFTLKVLFYFFGGCEQWK